MPLIAALVDMMQKLYNPAVIWLLRSPLHGLMSGSTMLITYTGRRSGKEYTTPISYMRDGEELLAVGAREHSWWKNLRGGAPVTIRVLGRDLRGIGEAFEGEAAEGGLLAVLRTVPAYRRYWKVELDADGSPNDPDALRRVAEGNALISIRDLSEAGRT